jgi:hypothetical protein
MKTKLICASALASALLLASASSLMAQSDVADDDDKKAFKTYVSLGQNLAHGHGHDLTQCTWGGIGQYHAEVGMQFYHELSTLIVRPNAGYTRLLGNPKEGMVVYDAAAAFVGFDLVYSISKRFPLTATMGPSFHFWNVDEVNFATRDNSTSNGDVIERGQGTTSVRFGWRMGLGYEINNKYRVDFTYTMTEWRSNRTVGDDNPYIPGVNPSLPAYFTIKASYSF